MRHHTIPQFTGILFFKKIWLSFFIYIHIKNLIYVNDWNIYIRHGVRQILTCWSDGPSYITQCPVQSGQTFTYEFTLVKQKGTLFWHAHFSWLRATVYGAIIIYPKKGVPYPFKSPYEEHTIILGQWFFIFIHNINQNRIQNFKSIVFTY